MGIGVCIPLGVNLFHRTPGSHLEDSKGVLKDDRVASLQVLMVVPMIAGITQALSVMISRQIAYFFTQSEAAASIAAIITFCISAYFSSLSLKFDSSLKQNFKKFGKMEIVSFLSSLFTLLIISLTPLKRICFQNGDTSIGLLPILFAVLLSFIPMLMLESMKLMKKDDSAQTRDS